LRAYGYIRVSTTEQAEEGYSLAAQERSLREYAERTNLTLAHVYADEGISAKDTKRPGLQAALAAIGKGDVLVVWKLDRLSRSVRDTEAIFSALDKRSASFVSVMEPHLSTAGASGVLVRQITAVFAEHYRRSLGENVRHGMVQLVRQGKWAGGPAPYGYDLEAGTLTPNQYADVVRKIYRDYVEGESIRAIALALNRAGVRTRQQALWSSATVSYILRQPFYCGLIGYGKTAGKRIENVQGTHQAIVAPELWQRVQDTLERRKALPSRTAGGLYPLTGAALCGLCNRPLIGDMHRQARRYRCSGRKYHGACIMQNHAAHTLEAAFVDALAELTDMARVMELLPDCAPSADAESLRRRADDADTRIRRLDQAYDAGAMEPQEYADKRKPIVAERQSLRQQLADLGNQARAATIHQAAITLPVVWQAASPAQRKELVQSSGLRVRVFPGYRVELVFG